MLFCICPCMLLTPKFWHTYVFKYGDFMVIVEPCRGGKGGGLKKLMGWG